MRKEKNYCNKINENISEIQTTLSCKAKDFMVGLFKLFFLFRLGFQVPEKIALIRGPKNNLSLRAHTVDMSCKHILCMVYMCYQRRRGAICSGTAEPNLCPTK